MRRPVAIALVDGLFESAPSVWHHELLDAVDSGVALFAGGSMGALRAAELSGHGVVGVGRVYGWYRDGVIRGDDEVALLHAGPELAFRALSLPLVQVRHAAEVAVASGALARRSARALVDAAAGVHYAERTWRAVLAAAAGRLSPRELEPLRGRLAAGVSDVKADDARATVSAAAAFARGAGTGALARPPRPLSSLARRRKLAEGDSRVRGRAVRGSDVLAALGDEPGARRDAEDGLRRLVLAGLARSFGLAASEVEIAAAERAWLSAAHHGRRGRAAFLAASGLDDADARRLAEDLALEGKLLAVAARVVPDGPAPVEGLALAARLDGRWAATAAALADGRRPRRRLSTRPMSKRGRSPARPPGEPAEAPFHSPFAGLRDKLGVPAAAPGPEVNPAPRRPAPARAVVRMERKGRGGKEVTVVEKLELAPTDLARWLSDLKSSLGCGGVVEEGALVLQGDLRVRVKALLEKRGVRKVTVG